jgi:hypothetical protein
LANLEILLSDAGKKLLYFTFSTSHFRQRTPAVFLPAVSLGSDLILHAIGAIRCHVTCKPWSGGHDELNWRSSGSGQQDVLWVFIDVVIVTKAEKGPDIRRRDLFV